MNTKFEGDTNTNTKKVLNALKEEVKNPNKKRVELTDEELKQVCGGNWIGSSASLMMALSLQRMLIAWSRLPKLTTSMC